MHDLVEQLPVVEPVAHIVVSGNNESATLDLHDGESALVGQAAGCQLRLQDADVAPHQCMLELRDGQLTLENWSDDESTKVNGAAVTEQVPLKPRDTVGFGSYNIRYELDSPAATGQPDSKSNFGQTTDSYLQPRPIEAESVDASTIAVLYSEIDFLQRELEQRDAAAAKSEKKPANTSTPPAEAPQSDTRLNELLDELQVADSRLLDLTDEIRLLEELRAAEQEEQRQVTAWVNEVESLIAKREAEQLAQMDILRAQIKQEKEDRLRSEQRAKVLAADQSEDAISEAAVFSSEEQTSLREQLSKATERANRLEQECQTLRDLNVHTEVEARVREAIRLERLELAQERARVSRREHDLSTKLRQVECQLEIKSPVTAEDKKIQVFREKLKEFQHEEMDDAGSASVGQRLVKLWQNLDGRSE